MHTGPSSGHLNINIYCSSVPEVSCLSAWLTPAGSAYSTQPSGTADTLTIYSSPMLFFSVFYWFLCVCVYPELLTTKTNIISKKQLLFSRLNHNEVNHGAGEAWFLWIFTSLHHHCANVCSQNTPYFPSFPGLLLLGAITVKSPHTLCAHPCHSRARGLESQVLGAQVCPAPLLSALFAGAEHGPAGPALSGVQRHR